MKLIIFIAVNLSVFMKKLMIIEDEPSVRILISTIFRQKNWEIFESSNAENYLDKYKKQTFNLYIVDLCLPEMSGIRLLQNHFDKTQKVIIISGFISSALGREFFDQNNFNFLEKPFTSEILLNSAFKLIGGF
jgi:two-component system, response regulator YesN